MEVDGFEYINDALEVNYLITENKDFKGASILVALVAQIFGSRLATILEPLRAIGGTKVIQRHIELISWIYMMLHLRGITAPRLLILPYSDGKPPLVGLFYFPRYPT